MFSWGSVPVSTASLKWNVQGSSVIAGLSSSPRAALPVPPAPLGTPSIAVLSLQGQAQECLLEKSMLDNRKSFLVARISAQVSSRSCCQHGPAPTAGGPGAAERGALGRSGDGGRNSWLWLPCIPARVQGQAGQGWQQPGLVTVPVSAPRHIPELPQPFLPVI